MNRDICNSIMVVEDDDAIRESIEEILKSEGYGPIVSVKDGQEALEYIKVIDKPCLIILDIKLPKVDGFQFISKIQETGIIGVTHIVIVTALPKIEIPIPNVPVVKKPFDIVQFLDLVAGICRK